MKNDYKQERICSLCCPIKSHFTGIPGDHSSDKKGAVSAKGFEPITNSVTGDLTASKGASEGLGTASAKGFEPITNSVTGGLTASKGASEGSGTVFAKGFKPISNPVAGDSIGSKGGSEESGKSKAAKGPGRRGPKPKAKPSTVANSPHSLLHTYKLPAQTHPPHKAMYKTLKKRIMRDAQRCKAPREVAFARMEPGWGSLSQYALSDGQWQDGYCSTSRSTSGVIDYHMKDPFMPSPDAVFPYVLSDGQMQYHAPGNLFVTTVYINLLKHTYIPAMLAHLVNYMKSDHGPEAVKRFMKEMEDVYLVGLRTPWVMKKRLLASPSEYAAAKREWITGLPGSFGHGKMQFTQKHYIHKPKKAPYPDWRPEGFERICKLISAIERNFHGQELRRGPDGCPFPSQEPEMPSDWSWWSCWLLFGERLARMVEWCNRYWDCMCDCCLQKTSANHTQWTIPPRPSL